MASDGTLWLAQARALTNTADAQAAKAGRGSSNGRNDRNGRNSRGGGARRKVSQRPLTPKVAPPPSKPKLGKPKRPKQPTGGRRVPPSSGKESGRWWGWWRALTNTADAQAGRGSSNARNSRGGGARRKVSQRPAKPKVAPPPSKPKPGKPNA